MQDTSVKISQSYIYQESQLFNRHTDGKFSPGYLGQGRKIFKSHTRKVEFQFEVIWRTMWRTLKVILQHSPAGNEENHKKLESCVLPENYPATKWVTVTLAPLGSALLFGHFTLPEPLPVYKLYFKLLRW